MKKASIISIGNELLSGQTLNTNAAYLGERLLSISLPVLSCYTIADDLDSIIGALNSAGNDADIILITGGLGPTDDDLTRHALAKFLNKDLQMDSVLLEKIRKFFTGRDRLMPVKSKIQAYIPAGTKVLENNLGTAAGILAERQDELIFALPGVPSEMKKMFEESVLPKLRELTAGNAIVIRKLRCFGAGESDIAELLGPIMKRGRNPLINCTASSGVITLHIIAVSEKKSQAEQLAEKDEKLLRGLLGELVYGTGQESLAEVVGRKLAQQKKTIAVAESCTGGILAKLLTDIPGASEYFVSGWVTYSNSAKISELGVKAELIDKHGAVSKQVADAMAQAARKKAGADFAIGITGIAGPAGASEEKPVGLVYIALDSLRGCVSERFVFCGDRDSIRLRAAQTALNTLRLRL